MTSKQEDQVLSDTPLLNPDDDQLGYKVFAAQMANSLEKFSPEEGFVIGIHGKWGTGKTTLINFILHNLEKKRGPIIVKFNPWWYSDDESLVRHFFHQLEHELVKWKVITAKTRVALHRFATLLGHVADPWWLRIPGASRVVEFVLGIPYASEVIGFIKKLTRTRKDQKAPGVIQLKDQVVRALRRKKRQVVVVIDDIDRLTADQIQQVFRLVKAIGDFPYVTYLLAYDEEVVIPVLTNVQKVPGKSYLEKIVQLPISLPLPEPGSVERMLTNKLDVLISDTPEQYWDSERWAVVFHDSVKHFIKTPRDVVRLINLLRFTYPALEGDVNPVDFIGISLVSIFHPKLHELIRKNQEMFTGAIYVGPHSDEADRIKPFHESWRDDIPEDEREAIVSLMTKMFPKLEAVFGNTHYTDEEWEAQLRICHPNIFNIYFQLTRPKTAFANTEMMAVLNLTENQKALEEKLLAMAKEMQPQGMTRVSLFMERLEAYTDKTITEKQIPVIVKAFLNVGDQLSPAEDEPRGIFGLDNEFRIIRVLHQLLKRLSQKERFEILRDAIREGAALSLIAHDLGLKRKEITEKDEADRSGSNVTENNLKELEQMALKKVRAAASDDSLLTTHGLPQVLFRWRDWASEKEPREWVQGLVQDDSKLANLLEGFVQFTLSSEMGTGLTTRHIRIGPKHIEAFADPATLVNGAKRIVASNDFSKNQRAAAQQFLKEYEMHKRGLDPNNPLANRELQKGSADSPK